METKSIEDIEMGLKNSKEINEIRNGNNNAMNNSNDLRESKYKNLPKPLYNTYEYYFYYAYLLGSVIYMFYSVIDLSNETHPNYDSYKDRLSDGWMFGRKEDLSDGQFNSFRSRYKLIVLLMLLHVLLSQLISNSINLKKKGYGIRNLFLNSKIMFSGIFSMVLLFALHGYSMMKLFIFISLNYILGKLSKRNVLNPIFTWVFNIAALLFCNYFSKQVKFEHFFMGLKFMDEFNGLLPRWDIHYNITALRMISFNMDYYWSKPNSINEEEVQEEEEEKLNEKKYLTTSKQRTQYELNANSYNFVNYFTYLFYPPLYLAGPIITFNDFIYQTKFKNPNLTVKTIGKYLIRLILVILLMEFMLHYIYVQALCKSKNFENYTPYQLLMISFFSLKFIWLKLLIIWRFFRLWAMMDGIDTVENMGRCMTNNYSIQGFWKGWHCSYNRWLVRYLYVPLGGAKYSFLNIWVIFTFVALWHDTELDLLAWGWLIALFFLPEMIAVKASKKWKHKSYYRYLRAIGGTLNVLMLMTANLVGFAIQRDGFYLLLGQLVNFQGLFDLFLFLSFLYVDVQCMIEIRNQEFRNEAELKLNNKQI
ncbi:MBOAT-domain-containing protein [Neoconidiobolus thromboides FSU 785]|nr:MBOAT-domain-containing protein [Neoconidiobolus thromboides FSU 785]